VLSVDRVDGGLEVLTTSQKLAHRLVHELKTRYPSRFVLFDLPALQLSVKARHGLGQFAGEFIATFGLILTILGTVRYRREWVPASVGLYITAAYWFTSSTSFANPAITVARSLTNTFAGIAPHDAPLFIVAQLLGAAGGAVVARQLFDKD